MNSDVLVHELNVIIHVWCTDTVTQNSYIRYYICATDFHRRSKSQTNWLNVITTNNKKLLQTSYAPLVISLKTEPKQIRKSIFWLNRNTISFCELHITKKLKNLFKSILLLPDVFTNVSPNLSKKIFFKLISLPCKMLWGWGFDLTI